MGADRLTRANCALIAATLPNPLKYSTKEPSQYMLKRQTQIMRQMRNLGGLKMKGGEQ
jgi:monofunctional biosynthetic peptidoglycan transglycosylase